MPGALPKEVAVHYPGEAGLRLKNRTISSTPA